MDSFAAEYLLKRVAVRDDFVRAYSNHLLSYSNQILGSPQQIHSKTNHHSGIPKKVFWTTMRWKMQHEISRIELSRTLQLERRDDFDDRFWTTACLTLRRKRTWCFLSTIRNEPSRPNFESCIILWKFRWIWSIGGKEKPAEFHQFRSDCPIYQGLCHKQIAFRSEMISICNGMV